MSDEPKITSAGATAPTMWDERYDAEEYLFGTAPNDFLKEAARDIAPCPVLCLADGEGRNGVHLASLGFDVTSVDSSRVALSKARKLAVAAGVTIQTELADLLQYDLGDNRWACIVSIFFHLPSAIRQGLHRRVAAALAPGGCLILEAYTPEQLKFKTGGPPVADSLMTLETLKLDFPDLDFLHAIEMERDVVEGIGHHGHAAVVQLVARKPG